MSKNIDITTLTADGSTNSNSTFFMSWRDRYEQLSTTSKLFVICIFLETVIIIALTIQRMVNPMTEFSEQYSILMLINALLLSIFAVDGVLSENLFQLVGFNIVSVCTLGIVAYQFGKFIDESHSDTGDGTSVEVGVIWARFLSVCIGAPINIVLSYLVYKSFGWFIYKKLGADRAMQEMYQTYQIFVSLIKLDLQFAINLVIVAGFFLAEGTEFLLEVIALLISLVCAFLGWGSVRQENKKGIIAFFVLAFVEPIYIIVKFVMYSVSPPDIRAFLPLIFVTGILSILCRVLLVVWAALAWKNYGKGLKDIFSKEKERFTEVTKLLRE